MEKIKRNSKIFYLIFGFIDACLLIATVFLLVAALLFRGGSAPALFGRYVFLAETDAFSAVKKGSALIVDPVEMAEIAPGNIIIFTDEQGSDRIGEVQTVASDEGIYTFTVRTDIDSRITVGQSHMVGKGIYYSEFLGVVVSFATSPAGVCLIAILPCAAFVIFEIIGIVKRKAPQPTVDTVKKQYETPTYIPPVKNKGQADEDDRPAFSADRQRLVEAAGLFTPGKKPEPPPKEDERAPISGRDIEKLIRETKARYEHNPLFAPDPPAEAPKEKKAVHSAATEQHQGRAAAVSAYRANAQERPEINITPEDEKPHNVRKKTAERHAERAAHSNRADRAAHAAHPDRTAHPDRAEQAAEVVKRYVPPKVKYVPRVNRLDSLLREDNADSDGGSFDIDDILKNIEAREK